jgi:hypothetical protein
MTTLATLKETLRRHPRLMSAAILMSLLALFFAGRFVTSAIYWSQHRNEPIKAWMTVGYIGRSWDLHPRAIDDAAGLPKPGDHPYTLQEIADQRGVPVETIIEQVEDTVAKMLAERKQLENKQP